MRCWEGGAPVRCFSEKLAHADGAWITGCEAGGARRCVGECDLIAANASLGNKGDGVETEARVGEGQTAAQAGAWSILGAIARQGRGNCECACSGARSRPLCAEVRAEGSSQRGRPRRDPGRTLPTCRFRLPGGTGSTGQGHLRSLQTGLKLSRKPCQSLTLATAAASGGPA